MASGQADGTGSGTGKSPTQGTVVTRFAPSPTGFLHIGGARTALFNWLYARHFGGKTLLRIEDTDKARSTKEAIDAILDGLDWLGFDYDEAPVFQSERAARHAEVANMLLEAGHAYRCYATAEELEQMRAEQRAAKRPLRYDGRWRDRDPADAPEGAPFVVRLKTPTDGVTEIEDAVQGKVKVRNEEIDDYILLRSDGSPTYMLAVVVDDHDMGVTHVIRGDDHLNNAFRQLPIYRAMNAIEGGWDDPVYAHIPLIHGADGAKLSKRHGAMGVDAYRDELGLLPEAVVNYLLRLGWGHGDQEIFSRDEAVALFDLPAVGKSPSRFDFKKLANMNGQYMREADDARLADLAAPRIAALEAGFDAASHRDLLVQAMPSLKARAKNLDELAEGALFLFRQRPLPLDDKAASLLQAEGAGELLADVANRLEQASDWSIEPLETELKAMAEERELGLGKVAQPLRAALTGQSTSPGIFDVLVLLGREESLARIREHAGAAVP
ncbi:glutamate--tRNA ligase [Croceicoccus sp. Ery15]|uniref:glutamate--tRNA ligase n=1 Tax=Croceicoccus sp. Ery15 TaxID=1703338 RepID=UPI001E5C7A15|nr:glutamate--tRNA ligase [Croceicoccus sp. Ery15]